MGIVTKLKNLIKYRNAVSTYLDFKADYKNPYWGSISVNEVEIIKSLSKESSAYEGPIVEIGALFGLTSQVIASHKASHKKFYVIENYIWNPFGLSEEEHKMFLRRNLYDCMRNRNTDLIERDNTIFYNSYQGIQPSMIFIDADHSYEGVKTDIQWAVNNEVNIICGHDYKAAHPGVVKAVDEIFGHEIELKESIWIRRKN